MSKRFQTKLAGDGQRQYDELFRRYEDNPILSSHDWPYPVNTVFNPAATLYDGKVLLLARVEDRRGMSHLTKAVSADGCRNWKIDEEPTLEADPEHFPEDKWGIEDPRITYLPELAEYAVTFTSYSGGGPLVSLALTKDFRHFKRLGPVTTPDDKDAALFPRRIDGKWWLIHRPVSPMTDGTGCHIWVSKSPDMHYWGEPEPLLLARKGGWWDANKIGLSAPPLETPEGWLLLYHGVRTTCAGAIYRLGLALLDHADPMKVLRRSDEWIFGPREEYERKGDVADVVFPCGWVYDKATDEIKMYYGGADTCIALAVTTRRALLDYLKTCPVPEA
ncbi:glycosidase [Selenomonas bovis]|uniref:glycoside hydrolase family 130 protein n=1 Tax=Selenomonas bovis TaxID=416586 RepID=UPI003AB98C07